MKISVIGAVGSVGSPVAFYLAATGLAEEMVIVDIPQVANRLEQHAIDMSTAVANQDVKVIAGDYPDIAGSDIIVNAAGMPQGLIKDRMEMLPKNIPLVRDIALKIKEFAPDAIIISATNPADPLNYCTKVVGDFDRFKTLGYSLNDSTRFREFIAYTKGVKRSQVQAFVVGEHGSTQVPLFSTATIDGAPVSFTEEEKSSILGEIPNILKRLEELQSGRTAGWTCATGIAQLVQAIKNDTGAVFPCSVVLDGEYGQSNVSMSVPVILGAKGAKEVKELKLEPEEQAKFEISAAAMNNAARIVDEELQK